MTQMLLFDSPAAVTTFPTAVAEVAEPSKDVVAEVSPAVAPSIAKEADRGGMHRMGDLARLVIMRYELVAQRRAALAAKRAK